MIVCACASPACMVNGCAIERGYRERYVPAPAPRVLPPIPVSPLGEEDLRRIVREEIARALKGAP